MQVAKQQPHSVDQGVSDLVTQELTIGNTRIIVRSPNGVIVMEPSEQREWFRRQWEQGNPVVRTIAETALEIAASFNP